MISLPAVHAVVPFKELAQAKSRLAPALAPAERSALALAMLRHVLDVLGELVRSRVLHGVWLVSRDQEARHEAAQRGAWPLIDAADGLNAALEQARTAAQAAGAAALLVVPADMPRLAPADGLGLLAALCAAQAVRRGPACVLAPDHALRGTNALALTLPSPLPFCFGTDSLAAHLDAAHRLGVGAQIYASPALARDIDTPADLHTLRQYIALEPDEQERSLSYGDDWLFCGP
jgi:2-phospho-L-lactate guanylyltransferase